jgi:hypothetical protein
VQCAQAFSLPNILVRDANNEKRASLALLARSEKGWLRPAIKKTKSAVSMLHAARELGYEKPSSGLRSGFPAIFFYWR